MGRDGSRDREDAPAFFPSGDILFPSGDILRQALINPTLTLFRVAAIIFVSASGAELRLLLYV